MGGESGKLQDVAMGQLVDCTPEPEPPDAPRPPTAPAPPTPTTEAAHATIEQTGAGPPPE